MITFGDVKASRVARVAACCPNSQDFADLVNDAIRELIRRGNWVSTLQFATVMTYGRTVTWNRHVGTVLAVDINGRATQPFNRWYDWTPPGTHEIIFRFKRWQHRGCGTLNTVAIGQSPVFNQIDPKDPKYLQFYPTDNADNGKTVTVFGLDQNNQEVFSRRADGTIQPGELFTLQLPFVTSAKTYRRVDRIVKDLTVARVNAFQFDALLSTLTPLGIYEPNETSPMYQQSQVPHDCWQSSCCPRLVSALVKTEFVPVQYNQDWVQIDNLDALAEAVQSVKHSDAYDHQGAEAAMVRAMRELNYQLRDKFPLEQTTTSFRPFGTATLSKLHLGMT